MFSCGWDTDLLLLINGMHTLFLDGCAVVISNRLTWIPLYLCLLLLLYYQLKISVNIGKKWYRQPWALLVGLLILIVACVGLSDLISSGIIKPLFHRPRPTRAAELDGLLHLVNGYRGGRYGFVSSHAANTFSLALLYSLIYAHISRKSEPIIPIWTVSSIMALYVLLNCWSRMYMGVHYPTDILGGLIVGGAVATICYYVYLYAVRHQTADIPDRHLWWILLCIWVAMDFAQACLMEIHADEAYYGIYGEHLAWGYYDHPPMVALMTFLSRQIWFMGGNLSIRLLTVLMHAATVGIIWKIIMPDKATYTRKSVFTFFLIASSLVMFNAVGFLTTPDAPLLFFTALFLLFYKRYLEHGSWLYAFLIGIAIAGMVLSKYMAVLVVLFVVCSNFRLIKDIRMWFALLLALLLVSPHLWWQYANDFPSFAYHLTYRNKPFRWWYPLEYIPNQLAVFNPVSFCLMIWLAWKGLLAEDRFRRTLCWLITGFIVFFWLTTVRGHAEPHWTMVISIAALILIHDYVMQNKKRWLTLLLVSMTCLAIIARIVLMTNCLPVRTGLAGKQAKYDCISAVCGHTPVVFTGSFQNPSLYHFFENSPTTVLSDIRTRRTQFDLLETEMHWQGHEAYIITGHPKAETFENDKCHFSYLHTRHLQTANRIEVFLTEPAIVQEDSVKLTVEMQNPYRVPFLIRHEQFPVRLLLAGNGADGLLTGECRVEGSDTIAPQGSQTYRLTCPMLKWKKQEVTICIDNGIVISQNSKPIKLTMEYE